MDTDKSTQPQAKLGKESPVTSTTIQEKESESFPDDAKLVLEMNSLVFKFQEKDEDLETTNNILIINKGGAPRSFKWDVSSTGVFKVNPMTGVVPSESALNVSITYLPSGTNFKGESERLSMQVENGETQYLNCVGYINEARCGFKETIIDFGDVVGSQQHSKVVHLKNKHKTTAVFKVSSVLSSDITVTPMRGRIGPDGSMELEVTVGPSGEKEIVGEIIVDVRGGKQLTLPVKANIITA